MPSLPDLLLDPVKRAELIASTAKLIDEEVAAKSGLTGLALKAGYRLVKGFKPGFITEMVTALLPDFAKGLQPFIDEAGAQGKGIASHFVAESGRAAEALLGITDERARASKLAAIRSAYDGLRGSAKRHVEAAMPRLGALLQRAMS